MTCHINSHNWDERTGSSFCRSERDNCSISSIVPWQGNLRWDDRLPSGTKQIGALYRELILIDC